MGFSLSMVPVNKFYGLGFSGFFRGLVSLHRAPDSGSMMNVFIYGYFSVEGRGSKSSTQIPKP